MEILKHSFKATLNLSSSLYLKLQESKTIVYIASKLIERLPKVDSQCYLFKDEIAQCYIHGIHKIITCWPTARINEQT